MSLNVSGLPLGSVVGGWLVAYSLDFALILAATTSLIAALGALLLIPPQPNDLTHGSSQN
jgi:hypothetical protein